MNIRSIGLTYFFSLYMQNTNENYIFISYFFINYFDKLLIIYKNLFICINYLRKLKNNLIKTGPKSKIKRSVTRGFLSIASCYWI
jgi:hypothetical protein